MSKAIQGIYRNGQIELLEAPAANIKEGPVLVTFLETGEVDLKDRGVSEDQAAALRANLDCVRTAKTRSALVIQRDDLNSSLSQVIVSMITSRAFRSNHPSRLPVV